MRWNLKAMVLSLMLVTFLAGCSSERQDGSMQGSNAGYTAFTNVNVVPMTSEIIWEDQTVLVEGDRIIAVGPASSVPIPEEATIIDGEGAYLMPGLADMHMHTRQDWESGAWPVSPLLLYLANGVTTIRDFGPSGEDLTYALKWRDQIEAGGRIGPMIYTSGRILFVSPLGDPQGLVQENYDLGFDFLKLYSYLSKEDFHLALETSERLGMYSAGHVPYAVGLEMSLAEGMDEIAHVEELLFEFIQFDRDRVLEPDEWVPYLAELAVEQFEISSHIDGGDFDRTHGGTIEQVVEQLLSAEAPVCTTMSIDDVIQLKLFHPQSFLERPESRYSPEGYLDLFRQGEEKHQLQCEGMEDLCAFKYAFDRWILTRLHQASVPLLLATDSGTGGMGIVPGFSLHDELRILVENGFSPYEAIATGTVNASLVVERMVGGGDFGTIEVGKRADLLLVDGNPLEDVEAIKDIRGVMAAGRWYSQEVLKQWISGS
jgi:hypothetical protein